VGNLWPGERRPLEPKHFPERPSLETQKRNWAFTLLGPNQGNLKEVRHFRKQRNWGWENPKSIPGQEETIRGLTVGFRVLGEDLGNDG